jgi:hypothetical protein
VWPRLLTAAAVTLMAIDRNGGKSCTSAFVGVFASHVQLRFFCLLGGVGGGRAGVQSGRAGGRAAARAGAPREYVPQKHMASTRRQCRCTGPLCPRHARTGIPASRPSFLTHAPPLAFVASSAHCSPLPPSPPPPDALAPRRTPRTSSSPRSPQARPQRVVERAVVQGVLGVLYGL